ncbi:hypothetical protein FV242_32730 [Methylobacterium sp. WL64]|uniref:hypothetical protein n=1 Tax=Methylobacterium sp. WL64 TaxID=2603894 RepID=UPI0011C929DB|nr:hypothetical protein [Methylobacterium sp. WL64]TXM96957.1 hypothetical protein FV242_32730 [Methylobacterium sp. WL64]
MAKNAQSGQRASIARTSRVRQERADKAEQQRAAAARPTAQWKEQERKVEERKIADRAAAAEKAAAQKAEAERKRDDAAKVALKRVEDNKKRTEQRRQAQLQADAKRTFNRQAEDKRAAAAEAQKVAATKRAEAYMAAREKAQQADVLASQRHTTSQIRNLHRKEMQSHRQNAAEGHILHAAKMGSIDAAERRDLKALDQQRGSIAGRVASIVRPGHFAQQEKTIKDRHEADRMQKHRDHEAFKERQSENAQKARLRQVQERKWQMELHRFESIAQRHAQQTNRAALVEERRCDFTRATQREQTREQSQDRDQTQQQGMQRTRTPA